MKYDWRKTKEEVPMYSLFGQSPEVIGLDKYRNRGLYIYNRGEWYKSVDYGTDPCTPPILWHYLLSRPNQEELNKENN